MLQVASCIDVDFLECKSDVAMIRGVYFCSSALASLHGGMRAKPCIICSSERAHSHSATPTLGTGGRNAPYTQELRGLRQHEGLSGGMDGDPASASIAAAEADLPPALSSLYPIGDS